MGVCGGGLTRPVDETMHLLKSVRSVHVDERRTDGRGGVRRRLAWTSVDRAGKTVSILSPNEWLQATNWLDNRRASDGRPGRTRVATPSQPARRSTNLRKFEPDAGRSQAELGPPVVARHARGC